MEKKAYFLAVEVEDGVYCGSFPDFECVVDQGDTLEELVSNAKELLNFFICDMVESGEKIPDASDGLEVSKKIKGEVPCLVPVTIYPPRRAEETHNDHKKTYFMFVHESEDTLWCEFPDFFCCMTDGENLEDLMKNAADALESVMSAIQKDEKVLPFPSNLDEIKAKADVCENAVLFITPVTVYITE